MLPAGSLFRDNRPDVDKNAEELRIELGQLRDVWRMDQDELKKLHAVCGRQGLCLDDPNSLVSA